MDDELREKIKNFLYENDRALDFCGHDLSGRAMDNIINAVYVFCFNAVADMIADDRLKMPGPDVPGPDANRDPFYGGEFDDRY